MRHSLLSIALLTIACSGCGQTGALYLPDRRSESVSETPAQSDSPSTEREEKRQDRRGEHDRPAAGTDTPVTLPDPDRPAQTPPGSDNR
ncbi:MAG: lipoprotein [Xanthomonadaceae bacterium]|nr:lipoprotein [Xanthomonadaceae bacterium]